MYGILLRIFAYFAEKRAPRSFAPQALRPISRPNQKTPPCEAQRPQKACCKNPTEKSNRKMPRFGRVQALDPSLSAYSLPIFFFTRRIALSTEKSNRKMPRPGRIQALGPFLSAYSLPIFFFTRWRALSTDFWFLCVRLDISA
jgi:hypothetical protein